MKRKFLLDIPSHLLIYNNELRLQVEYSTYRQSDGIATAYPELVTLTAMDLRLILDGRKLQDYIKAACERDAILYWELQPQNEQICTSSVSAL